MNQQTTPGNIPTFRRAATRDFDEQASLLQGWNQHYAQLSSGRFHGEIVDLRFDQVHLFAESTSQALFQSGYLGEDLFALGIPLHAGDHGSFCGEIMYAHAVHIFTGESGFEFYSPHALTMGGIVLPAALLEPWLENTSPAGALGTQARLLAVAPDTIHEARNFLRTTFDLCTRQPALLQSPRFRKQLQDATLNCVADLLSDGQAPDDRLTPQKRWNIVHQAQVMIEQSQDEAPGIESLCATMGISRRTLQYCFQDVLGMNPVAFIRARRLNGVRQMLKQGVAVTEAATAWGFWHFGHFSQEYKKQFGELPSDTLKHSLLKIA